MSRFLPRPYQNTPTAIRIRNESLEAIDRQSYLLNRSRSQCLCQCIDSAMRHSGFPLHESGRNHTQKN